MIYLLARAIAFVTGAWLMFLGFDMYTGLQGPSSIDALITMVIQLIGMAMVIWSITTEWGQVDDGWDNETDMVASTPLPDISWQDTQQL